MKKLILTALCVAFTIGANAQLKVFSDGSLAIGGTAYNSNLQWFQTIIHGNKAGIIQSSYGKYFRCGQSSSTTATIGTNCGNINFYFSGFGYNNIKALTLTEMSDRSLKEDIQPIENALDVITKMKAYSYMWKANVDQKNPNFGFIAQEMAELLPGITSTENGLMGISYTQIIPFLVQGMQEQQEMISDQDETIVALRDEIDELKELAFKIASYSGMDLSNEDIKPAAVLYQNKPNPFKERTTIQYELPDTFASASIMVFDMTGEMLESYPVYERDSGQLTIEGRQFKAGMYLYSLIVDDVEIDTKKMILNK